MQQKKRILLLATGGTIASRKSDNGLKPQITPEELIEYIPQVKEICDVEAVQLLNLDSTLETHGSCDLGALRRF